MNEKNIIEVTSDGLSYLDETGTERFIDFADCYQRHLDDWNDPDRVKRFKEANPKFSDAQLEASLKLIRSKKDIGVRNISVPCIVFFTEPPTQFTFSNRAEFDRVHTPIWRAGWRTFDGN